MRQVLILLSFVSGARHRLGDEACEFYALYGEIRKGSALNSMRPIGRIELTLSPTPRPPKTDQFNHKFVLLCKYYYICGLILP